MKKFVLQTFLFFIPFFILWFVTKAFYNSNADGDLVRMGFLSNNSEYRNIFDEAFRKKMKYDNFSNHKKNKQTKYSLLSIGDSFSKQYNYGYQNYLASNDAISLLNLDLNVTKNPIQLLSDLINGDFLDAYQLDFILLQSVERSIVSRSFNINHDSKIDIKNLKKLSFKNKNSGNPKSKKTKEISSFPPLEVVKFPLHNLLYHFDDNAYFSKVYKVDLNKDYFTGYSDLLFLDNDLDNVSINNKIENIKILNRELNTLSNKLTSKGIQLIVLPSPDKLDFYYDYISKKQDYEKPLFFDLMKGEKKDYIYIDSKEILSQSIDNMKDLYFYDDTHWSPYSSHILAKEILKKINYE